MKIEIVNEVINLEDGSYTAVIKDIIGYEENNKVLIKFTLEDGTIFIKFYLTEELSRYPWSNLFKALNTDNTDDLIGKSVEFEISNNASKKTDYVFSNIKKLKLV
ncbi:MAG: hypothetical protein NC177_15305 [Ruminococcus flavefaciens]|nr:hypothetical protein [Ruminococcus flavefaciens]